MYYAICRFVRRSNNERCPRIRPLTLTEYPGCYLHKHRYNNSHWIYSPCCRTSFYLYCQLLWIYKSDIFKPFFRGVRWYRGVCVNMWTNRTTTTTETIGRHFDAIFVTGCTESCHNDNFQCSQWRKFHQEKSTNRTSRNCSVHKSLYFSHWIPISVC